MNFWEEHKDWWKKKLDGHEVYRDAKKEIAIDLISLLELHGGKSILDVGGYKGGQAEFLPEEYKKHYKNIDIAEGFDITKDWAEQGLTEKYDIVMTSLVLIAIPPEEMPHLLDEIFSHAKKAVYFYEEKRPDYNPGQQLNEDYGGKWAVTLDSLIAGRGVMKGIRMENAKANTSWAKYTITK